MTQKLKAKIYEIFETSDRDNWLTMIDDYLIVALVVLDTTTFILQSSQELASQYASEFRNIQGIVVLSFTFEYILRLWCCTANPQYRHPIWGRIKFATTPLAIIDLMSFLPFYLIALNPELAIARSARILRLLRLFKISRYSDTLRTFFRVIRSKKDELTMTLFAVFILLIIASSLMYFAERNAQPEAFSSIPAAMWWGVVTLTTVGYGDLYPVTALGKMFGAILAFLGIGLFALPAGIIASGFSEEIERKRQEIKQQIQAKLERPLDSQQKRAIAIYIEESGEVMKMCVETAKQKFGDRFENEDIIRELAITLYHDAQSKFNL